MIGGDNNVCIRGQAELVESAADLREIIVCILDGGARRRPVDARLDLQQTVTLVVLRAVGIA